MGWNPPVPDVPLHFLSHFLCLIFVSLTCVMVCLALGYPVWASPGFLDLGGYFLTWLLISFHVYICDPYIFGKIFITILGPLCN